jgi:hypothetical protein
MKRSAVLALVVLLFAGCDLRGPRYPVGEHYRIDLVATSDDGACRMYRTETVVSDSMFVVCQAGVPALVD